MRDNLNPVLRGQLFHPAGPVLAETVRGRQQADAGQAFILKVDEKPFDGDGRALRRFEDGGERPEFAAHDDRITADSHEGRDARLFDDRLDAHAGTGTGGADDGRDLVLIKKFLGDVGRFGWVAFSVVDDQFEGASIDSALLVDLFDHHFSDQFGRSADEGCGTGQIEKRTDFNRLGR